MKHRILYMITLAELGGAQSHVRDLIEGLQGRYDVHLATGTEGPLTEAARKVGVPVYIIPGLKRAINPLSDIGALRDCIRLIRRLRPGLVHLHSSKAGLLGRVAAKLCGVPSVFTAHGWGFSKGVPTLRRLVVWLSEALASPLADHIICVSHYDRRLAEASLPWKKRSLITVHNGISPDAPVAEPVNQPVKIVMAARFHEQKAQRWLLHAFAAVGDTTAQLTFIGGGTGLAYHQILAQELDIAERVQFLGDRHDVPVLLAQAHIFALISKYEGLPLSILEAMRAGLPVLASDVGGIKEEVEQGTTGFLTPPGDIKSITDALSRLVTNPNLRKQLGEAGRRKFLEEFTLEQMLKETDTVYRQILNKGLT